MIVTNAIKKLLLFIVIFAAPALTWSGDNDGAAIDSTFTGEILTLLYVTDVRRSVAFYKALRFKHDYFYDYQEDEYIREWRQPYPPEYAEMTQEEGIRIALTIADESEQVYGGGVRHYFIVEDVDKQFVIARTNGIIAVPDEVEERPWINFFTVSDPDNHQIVIGEKNQTYYDQARSQIEALKE